MRLVLDTSAVLWLEGQGESDELFTTPGVVEEVRSKEGRQRLAHLEAMGVRVMEPDPLSVKRVQEKARQSHDLEKMSPVDVGILALALQLGAMVLSDDYCMQNVAELLSLKWAGQRAIKRTIQWTIKYRCGGCGRYWAKQYEQCPVCGSSVRLVRIPKDDEHPSRWAPKT